MSTKIEITIDGDLTRGEIEHVRWLLKDALGEYYDRRMTAEEYVEYRYPADQYESSFRQRKLEQVRTRNELSQKLGRGSFGAVLLPEPESKP